MKYFFGFIVGSAIVSAFTFPKQLAALEAAMEREEKARAKKVSN